MEHFPPNRRDRCSAIPDVDQYRQFAVMAPRTEAPMIHPRRPRSSQNRAVHRYPGACSARRWPAYAAAERPAARFRGRRKEIVQPASNGLSIDPPMIRPDPPEGVHDEENRECGERPAARAAGPAGDREGRAVRAAGHLLLRLRRQLDLREAVLSL